MTRGGFGTYMKGTPGMVQIDRVISVLDALSSGKMTNRQAGVALVGYGCDRQQADALMRCVGKVAA